MLIFMTFTYHLVETSFAYRICINMENYLYQKTTTGQETKMDDTVITSSTKMVAVNHQL